MSKTHCYNHYKTVLALRKSTLRVDMHIHCGDETDFHEENEMKSAINSVLSSAIIAGLDVVGVIAHTGPNIGKIATQIANDNQYDLYVIPGQEYLCTDKVRLLVYKMDKPLPPNLTSEQVCQLAHKQGGYVMAINLSKRQSQNLNKLKGQPSAPDSVEIYNSVTGGYRDIEIDYPKFVNSAGKNGSDLEQHKIFTLMAREDMEKLKLIPGGVGENYTPQYLQRADQIEQGENAGAVAEGNAPPAPTPQVPTQ